MKLIKKQIYVDDIERMSEDELDELLDDMNDRNVAYTIYKEIPPTNGELIKKVGVLVPVDFDRTKFSEEVYETKVLNDNIIEFPYELLEKMGWKEGDELEFSLTEMEREDGICVTAIVIDNMRNRNVQT